MRRVVVGTGPDGRSTVVADGEPTSVFQAGQRLAAVPPLGTGEAAVVELWATESPAPTREEAAHDRIPATWRIDCPPGATRWRLVVFGPGLAAPLHRTETLDYSLVLDGEVTLLLGDGGEVELRAGDGVVIPGLDHGWRTGERGCTKLLVMTGLADEPGGAAPTHDGTLARAAAETYIRLINEGRYGELGALFAEEAEWFGFGRDPRRGRQEIGDAYVAFLETITPMIRAGTLVAEGNRCVVELEIVDRETGAVRPGPIDHFTVDDAGLITRFAVYDQPRWEPEAPA